MDARHAGKFARIFLVALLNSSIILTPLVQAAEPHPFSSPSPIAVPSSCNGINQATRRDEFVECICRDLKANPDNYPPYSPAFAHCKSISVSQTTLVGESVMTAIDGASAAACMAACYNFANPLLDQACSCLGFADALAMFGELSIIMNVRNEAPGTAETLMLLMATLGIFMNSPSKCRGAK